MPVFTGEGRWSQQVAVGWSV